MSQPPEPPSRLTRLRRRIRPLFLLCVLAPTAFAGVYYGAIASDVYISESRFVVRNPQRVPQSGLGALLQGTGFTRSQDDTYSVHDFVQSRDALQELQKTLKLREAYADPGVDVINRFPGLSWDDSFEAFHRYYQRHVAIDYNSVSSISVLRVRAFTASDAQAINEALLQMGERLVNNLNDRSRRDLIEVAKQEVQRAEAQARAAALALSGFRTDRSIFDPAAQSSLQLQSVTRLREELLTAQTQLDELRRVAPGNPQVMTLSARVDALKGAIAQGSQTVTGGQASLAGKLPAYERLVLEKNFADRQLATALAALETALSDASRKQLYLERLVQPNLPDKAVEPRRLRSVLMVFAVGLLVWSVVSLVVASVKEHAE